jgi:hypothetical protein
MYEMYRRVHTSKHLDHAFPLHNGPKTRGSSITTISNFTLAYDIRKVKEIQEHLEMKAQNQVQYVFMQINLLGENINPMKIECNSLYRPIKKLI